MRRSFAMVDPTTVENVIVFRFTGGALHGHAIRSDQPQAAREARSFWTITANGTIGRRFDALAPSGPPFERYQVKSKDQVEDEIHITCEHVD
jgi:hypothetical protein